MNFDFNFFEFVLTFNAIKKQDYFASIHEHINPMYFENECVKTILFKVKDFYSENKTVPNLTEIKARLIDETQKQHFKQLLLEFQKLDSSYNEQELIKNTEHFLKTKAVYHAVLSTANTLGQNKSVDLSQTLKQFENACNISLVDNFGLDFLEKIDEYADSLKVTHSTFSTGIKWLDKMLDGGVMVNGKALYIVSAATNVGKSVILTNLACNALAQNKKVVIFTLEMSEQVYGKRVSSCLTKIPLKSLKENTENLVQSVRQYKDLHSEGKLLIKEYPTRSATVSMLKAYLTKLQQQKQFVPDLIVVDYLNLLKPSVVTGNSYMDIKSITEELRGLTYSFNGIPIFSATQLNRSGYGQGNPGIETTSESMGLSHTADVQLSLWADDTDKELGILRLGMQKNRFGVNFGSTCLKIDYDTLYVSETEDIFLNNENISTAKNLLDELQND